MVLLFGTDVGILFQALPDEGDDIVCNDGSLSAVVLAFPGDAVAVLILFDGVAGNVQHTGNLPLAHPVKPHSAYVFVNFQCDYHICTPPITISDYYKGFCVVAQLFVSVCSKMAHLYISVYIKNLLTIEKHTNCKFNPNIGEVSFDDIENSIIIAASLEEKWRMTKLSFDNSVRCDYNNIADDIADCDWVNSETVVEMKVLSINLHGESFTAEKLVLLQIMCKVQNTV